MLRETQPGRGGEIQLTDALATLVERGEPLHGVVFSGRRYDTGDRLDYLKAVVRLAVGARRPGSVVHRVPARVRGRAAPGGRVAVLTRRRQRAPSGVGCAPGPARARTSGRGVGGRHGRATVVRMGRDMGSGDMDGIDVRRVATARAGSGGTGTPPRSTCAMAPPGIRDARAGARPGGAAPGRAPSRSRRRARRRRTRTRRPSRCARVERHLDEILGAMPQPEPIELAVLDAQGLLCAEEVVSQRALPAFDQAALDGYAARSDDVAAASVHAPVELGVVGESVAGRGHAVVHRPGPGPEGGRRRDDAGRRRPRRPRGLDRPGHRAGGRAGRAAGRQLRAAHRGRRRPRRPGRRRSARPIGPAQISLLAAVGRERVLVRPRPRIAVLCAGTELVDVGTAPGARPDRRRQQLRAGRGRPRRRRRGLPLGDPARRTSAASPRCSRASCCAATSC